MIPDRNSTDPPESVRSALEEVAGRYSELARDLRTDLAGAEGREEVLELAERSTLEMLAYLPMSPVYCPFCNLHRPGTEDCQDCKYAARYGRCTEAGSVYDQALKAHYDLVRAVQDLRQGQFQAISPIPEKEVRAALEDQADRVIDLASRFGQRVRKTRTSEEVMTLKTEFMADLVRNLPVEKVCSLCGFEHRDLFEAKNGALLGLSRHWAAA
jgi:hypothetical protein